jgi:hypothetical protein
VTAAAANSPDVTLLPVLKLRASELQRIEKRRNAHLTMYEVMPADNRDLYTEALHNLREGLTPEKREAATDLELIAALFPNTVPEAVKREFADDGKAPTGAAADPDQVWRRVKAIKAFNVPLSAAEAKAMQDAGQVVELDETTQKPVVKIAEGSILVLDPQSAQEQIAKGLVEPDASTGQPGDRVYMRELRDYARIYRDLNLQIEELLRTTDEVNGQNAAIADAQQKVNGDIAYRQSEKKALTNDLGHYDAEQKLITAHAQALESSIAGITTDLSKTKNSNQQLETQLAALTRQAMEQASHRTAAGK